MRSNLLTALCLALFAAWAQAERRPEQRDQADLVVTGKISQITPKSEKFGSDGTVVHYSADVDVKQVEHGKGIKPGQTLTVTWLHVTKRPSKPFAGAYGHRYPIKAGDAARFWLMDRGEGRWEIVYNPKGVEKLTK
jgi:hypothetical protein